MDYEEEQAMELEALEAIIGEDGVKGALPATFPALGPQQDALVASPSRSLECKLVFCDHILSL